MKFGIFYELQLPRPWVAGDELRLYQNALSQQQPNRWSPVDAVHGRAESASA